MKIVRVWGIEDGQAAECDREQRLRRSWWDFQIVSPLFFNPKLD